MIGQRRPFPERRRQEAEATAAFKCVVLGSRRTSRRRASAVGDALHLAALRHYENSVRRLGEAFGRGPAPDNAEAAEKIRELGAKVTIKPSEDGVKIELQGSSRSDGRPQSLSASGGSVVAEERYHLSPQRPIIRYCLRACA